MAFISIWIEVSLFIIAKGGNHNGKKELPATSPCSRFEELIASVLELRDFYGCNMEIENALKDMCDYLSKLDTSAFETDKDDQNA